MRNLFATRAHESGTGVEDLRRRVEELERQLAARGENQQPPS
jgi:hypothetical protein